MGKWLGRDGGDRMFAPVTPLTAAHTAIAIIAMAVGVVVALTLRARDVHRRSCPGCGGGRGRCAAGDRDVVVRWGWRQRRDLFSGFGWLAVVLLAVAGACAPPGHLGAAHALIGLVVVTPGRHRDRRDDKEAMADRGGHRGGDGVRNPRRGCRRPDVPAGFGAGAGDLRGGRTACPGQDDAHDCAMGGAGTATALRIDHRPGLVRASRGNARRHRLPGQRGRIRRRRQRIDRHHRARRRDRRLGAVGQRGTGRCVRRGVHRPARRRVGGVGAGRPWAWLALVVAGLVVGIFITQGRGFAAKYQAVALACGAWPRCAPELSSTLITAPKDVVAGLLWPAVAVAAFAALGLAAALLMPTVRFRPFIRLTVEWVEVLALSRCCQQRRLWEGCSRGFATNQVCSRAAAVTAAVGLVALSANIPAAQAIPPPSVDPALVPPDGPPRPDQPMRRGNSCSTPITVKNPDVAQMAPGFNLLNISKAWQYSTGNGVAGGGHRHRGFSQPAAAGRAWW